MINIKFYYKRGIFLSYFPLILYFFVYIIKFYLHYFFDRIKILLMSFLKLTH